MSFGDELRASIRTPEQVANEIPDADKYTIRRDEKDDFEKMKGALKSQSEAYLKELDSLTKEEGIEYQLIAIYDDKMNKREYRWPIPGSMRIENVINVVAGVYIHLKVSMKI